LVDLGVQHEVLDPRSAECFERFCGTPQKEGNIPLLGRSASPDGTNAVMICDFQLNVVPSRVSRRVAERQSA